MSFVARSAGFHWGELIIDRRAKRPCVRLTFARQSLQSVCYSLVGRRADCSALPRARLVQPHRCF